MSAISAFKRCRKLFDLSYVRGIVVASSDVASEGTSFHEIIAQRTKEGHFDNCDEGVPMYAIALEYVRNRSLPGGVIRVEDPYVQTLLGVEDGPYFGCPSVSLRTTFDLVYKDRDGWIVGRDYKTFSKAPTYDVDMDFQGGIYIAALMRGYGTDRVRFEYEYVRRELPGVAHNKKGDKWALEDCYVNVPVVMSRRAADVLWEETQDVARDIVRAMRERRLYRNGKRKEFGSPCLGCFHDNMCKAEMSQGGLDDETIELLGGTIDEGRKV